MGWSTLNWQHLHHHHLHSHPHQFSPSLKAIPNFRRSHGLPKPSKPVVLHCTPPDGTPPPPPSQDFSRLPHVPWDAGSVATTMISYFSILHIPLGLGGLSYLAEFLHVNELDPQTKALSLVFLQLLELGGATLLIQSSLRHSNGSLQCFNFKFGDISGNRGWLVTSTCGLAIILLVMGATSETSRSLPSIEGYGKVEALKDLFSGSAITQLSTILLYCALTPFLEEIVYRGYLLQSLATRFGWLLAVLVSASIFAIAHLDLLSAPALFFVGCILGAAYTWSGNLAASFLIHIVYNAVILIRSLFT